MRLFKKLRLVAVLVLFLISLAVYLNTLGNGLVRDDRLVVLENKWITDVRFIPEMLTSAVLDFTGESGISNQYRPIYHLYIMAGRAFSGEAPWGYHLINILFHAFSSVLVFLLISRLFTNLNLERGSPQVMASAGVQGYGNILLAGLAALIFATHPINTESVAWISAVSELSLCTFYLLSLFFYIRYRRLGDSSYILSVLFFFIAACSKETAVTLPVVLVAYELVINRRGIFQIVLRLVPFGAAGVVYLALRFWTLKGFIPLKAGHLSDLSFFQLLINVPPLVVKYIGKLLLPISLNFDYVFDPVYSISEPRAFISALIIIGLIVIIIWRLALRAKEFSFALLLIFIPLLPALYIPALGVNTFTERYLYLPSIGFALLAVLIVNKVIVEFSRSKGYSLRDKPVVVIAVLSVLVIVLYSAGTVKRNKLWHSGYTLWGDTVVKSPGSRIARNNYAIELSKRGFQDEALVHLQEAVLIDPDSALTFNNLGIVYANKGMLKEALGAFKRAVELSPNDADARRNYSKALGLLKEGNK